jgi:hypothetical protein
MNTDPLTYRELDEMGCSTPHCSHDHSVIYMHQQCHCGAGLYVCYEKETRELIAECRKCEREVWRIALADDQGQLTTGRRGQDN